MNLQNKLKIKRKRRSFRVRNKQVKRGYSNRISIFRSSKHIYAQLIDDLNGKTLVNFSSLNLQDKSGDKKEVAKKVGLEFGKKALEKATNKVFFDRGKFLYHGRVKFLADGMREAGLKF